jgi:AraC-like DNA-binding protein
VVELQAEESHRIAAPMPVSDLLHAVDIRGRTWCYLDVTESGGMSLPPNSAIMFYMVLDGTMTLTCAGGAKTRLNTGEAIFITSGEAHALRTGPQVKVRALPFLSDEQNVDTPPTFHLGEGRQYCARLLCARLRPTWPDTIGRPMLPSVLRLDDAASSSPPGTLPLALLPSSGFGAGATVLLTRLASVLFTGALRRELLQHRSPGDAAEDPVLKAMKLVELRPGLEWSVSTLARAVGMGRSNFSAHFSRTTGKSPMEFVTEIRMQRAAQLIRDSKMKVADIGEAIGYGCEIAFNRRFVRHFGISPSTMRAETQKGSNQGGAEAVPSILKGRAPAVTLRDIRHAEAGQLSLRLMQLTRTP